MNDTSLRSPFASRAPGYLSGFLSGGRSFSSSSSGSGVLRRCASSHQYKSSSSASASASASSASSSVAPLDPPSDPSALPLASESDDVSPRTTSSTADDGSDAPGASSEPFLEIFARTQTPVGAMARAEAALAASEHAVRVWEQRKEAGETLIMEESAEEVRQQQKDTFWEWAPPDDDGDEETNFGGSGGAAQTSSSSSSSQTTTASRGASDAHIMPQLGVAYTPTPKLSEAAEDAPLKELAEAEPRDVPSAFVEMFAPKPLDVAFASDATAKAAGVAKVTPEKATTTTTATATTTTTQAEAVAAAPAYTPSFKSGSESEGKQRTWTVTWTEVMDNGATKVVTRTRGVTADGSVEFEETTWEASDAFSFKQLGAIKLGRTSSGAAWRESWCETLDTDADSGVAGAMKVHREAEKWGSAGAGGREWYETWRQTDHSDGRCLRSAYKMGKLADGEHAEYGHANEWHEKWGEEWPREGGPNGAFKWFDRWANTHGEGARKWGESWEEKHGLYAPDGLAARRMGEAWEADCWGNETYKKGWGESHFDGGVHKYGGDSRGAGWDVTEGSGEHPWYEGRPHHGGWQGALNHSPFLLGVERRGDRLRDATGPGGGGWDAL
ncbi:hypothetical protein RI054_27g111580 [Pseudoscourfieldia marina]